MTIAAQEILKTALQLPEKDRADLAASLIESLDQPFDAGSQASWAEEIRRRVAGLDSDVVTTIPWEEAREIIIGRHQ